MAENQLFALRVAHVIQREAACLALNIGVEQNLKQHISEFLAHMRRIVQIEALAGLVSFFQETSPDGKVGLRAVPRAAARCAENLDKRLADLNTRFSHMAVENEQKLENIRIAMEKKIGQLNEDNQKQLEEMRRTVDEKLQKTLEERSSKSFQMVSERLEQVYKGLGEMQNLAAGVGELK